MSPPNDNPSSGSAAPQQRRRRDEEEDHPNSDRIFYMEIRKPRKAEKKKKEQKKVPGLLATLVGAKSVLPNGDKRDIYVEKTTNNPSKSRHPHNPHYISEETVQMVRAKKEQNYQTKKHHRRVEFAEQRPEGRTFAERLGAGQDQALTMSGPRVPRDTGYGRDDDHIRWPETDMEAVERRMEERREEEREAREERERERRRHQGRSEGGESRRSSRHGGASASSAPRSHHHHRQPHVSSSYAESSIDQLRSQGLDNARRREADRLRSTTTTTTNPLDTQYAYPPPPPPPRGGPQDINVFHVQTPDHPHHAWTPSQNYNDLKQQQPEPKPYYRQAHHPPNVNIVTVTREPDWIKKSPLYGNFITPRQEDQGSVSDASQTYVHSSDDEDGDDDEADRFAGVAVCSARQRMRDLKRSGYY